MSLNKIKSLKIQRSSQRSEAAKTAADTSMVLAEEMINHGENIEISSRNENLTPLHSTPKRSLKQSISNDQLGIENRVSPILLPCTQDGGSEVAWDWQSPLTKASNLKRNRNNHEPIGTPKRATTLLQKKRNSNSPLLYKPIKRKLMRNNLQQDDVDKFTAEMKALSEQIKTLPKDDEATRIDDNLIIQIDDADFIESEDNNTHKNGQSIPKISLDELFDDSADDYMVKCSQEVEEKLRLESCREISSKQKNVSSSSLWHQNSYCRLVASREKPSESTKSTSSKTDSSSRKSVTKTSSLSSNTTSEVKRSFSSSTRTNNNITKTAKSPESSKLSTQKDIFSIPDDSFDDFLADCDFDSPAKNTGTGTSTAAATPNRYGKVYESPHSTVDTNSLKHTTKNSFTRPSEITSCIKTTKLFPRSTSNDSFASNDSTRTNATINTDKKFFKTKSLSSSTFDEQQKSNNANNSCSKNVTIGWKSSLLDGKTSKIVSNCNKIGSVNNGGLRGSNVNGDKIGMSHLNRSEQKGGPNSSGKTRSNNGSGDGRTPETTIGSQSTQICTPEEIERKRLEAKMKLEAKKKLMGRSKSDSASVASADRSNRPVVKR